MHRSSIMKQFRKYVVNDLPLPKELKEKSKGICVPYLWSNNGWDEDIPKTSPTFSITVACLDANNGKTIWSKVQNGAGAIGSGVLSNDVFIVGNMTGDIVAYRASNIKEN